MKTHLKILLLTLFLSQFLFSQKVFITENKNEADYKIYISKEKSSADWVIMKTNWKNEAKNGKWYFTKWKNETEYRAGL